jgi:hypothetical protein
MSTFPQIILLETHLNLIVKESEKTDPILVQIKDGKWVKIQ